MKKNKNILLIGFGAEIGSMLLYLNNPQKDGFYISTVLTNKIEKREKDSLLSLKARLIFQNPNLLEKIQILEKENSIIINKKKIKIIWGKIENINKKNFKKKFDAAIVATSKKHINNKKIMNKVLSISKFVFGVAENLNFPAIYPSLTNINDKFIEKKKTKSDKKIFVFGSCQSNGWMASLFCLLNFANKYFTKFKILNLECDIVHPDTPTGRLGTKSFEPRLQDPRNNLRPSFSQVDKSMKRLFPSVRGINTVSLRTLITPPGYMISRFFFSYEHKKKNKVLNSKEIQKNFKAISVKNKDIVYSAELPLGSFAYSNSETASNILLDDKYLFFKDNLFSDKNNKISELILQSYVHNTRGYSRSVINALKYFFRNKKKKFFD